MMLAGKRVLIVEDNFIIALNYMTLIEDEGGTVVGPASTRAAGVALARGADIDCAVLDVHLGPDDRSDDVARELCRRGVPFVFATGYTKDARSVAPSVPVLVKPFPDGELLEALERLVA